MEDDRGRQRHRSRRGALRTLPDPSAVSASPRLFTDRRDAGRQLAALLAEHRDERPVVLGMARGGVPVAAEVASALDAVLDVAVVQKIGAPQNAEFALGAVAEGGVDVTSDAAADALGLSGRQLRELIVRAHEELTEKTRRYRAGRPPVDLAGRTAILVDDGLATGRSAHAALLSLRKRGAAGLILAVPVAAAQSVRPLREVADEIVCLELPRELWAVGVWYEDFSATTDEELAALLAAERPPPASPGVADGAHVRQVEVELGDLSLPGDLGIPDDPRGVVVFAHGSGSSRASPRNQAVARALRGAGYATLLLDLLTPVEAADRAKVFDVPLLATRLRGACSWLARCEPAAGLPQALFGASTGAAAALEAAAEMDEQPFAVISRGGRPDLAERLPEVRAPTLLIVGGADTEVLRLNREAQARLGGPSELVVVPHATHLFEEPGALERVVELAIGWLDAHAP